MGNQKFLIAKGSGGGGLGDSIKSLLAAALYAELSQRILIVDWRGGVYSDGKNNPFDAVFEVINVDHQAELPESNSVYPPAWQGRITHSLHEIYTEDGWTQWDRAQTIANYSFDLSRLDYPQDVLLMWEFDQAEKLLRSFPDIHDLDGLYQYAAGRYLRPVVEFRTALEHHSSRFSGPTLGVHFRATQEFFASKGAVSVRQYFTELEQIVKQQAIHEMFLATDNCQMQTEFISRYPQVHVTHKWFADAGQPLHLNTPESVKLTALKEALLDMLLLSKCDRLLINTSSSFGQMARYFSSLDASKVYSVQRPSFKQRLLKWLTR